MPAQLNNRKPVTKPKIALENAGQLLQLINVYLWWLIALAVIIIIGLVYWFILGPKFIALYNKSQTFLPGRQQTLTDLSDLQEKLLKLNEEYTALRQSRQQDINRVSAVIPTEPDYASLFVQADVLVRANGLKLKGIDITKPVETPVSERRTPTAQKAQQPAEKLIEVLPKNVRSLQLTIGVGPGDYTQIKNLLSALESNLRLYDVQSVAFDPADAKSGVFPGFQIILKTYYRLTTAAATTTPTS
ncbi:MAG: hypothetical protein V1846_01480 [Candidatus Komeilibacteria bacterium]